MKRFTDTEKWKSDWFMSLSVEMKCLWIYLCDNCDNAGVWRINKKLAEVQIGKKIDWKKAIKLFSKRIL